MMDAKELVKLVNSKFNIINFALAGLREQASHSSIDENEISAIESLVTNSRSELLECFSESIQSVKNEENTANEQALAINSDARRALIALDATYEIESLATFICERVNAYHDEHELSSDQFMVKGLAMRIKQLNGVIMGAISDDCATITSLKNRLG